MDDFKPIFIAPGLEQRILVGLLSITGIIILVGWIAINENTRMEEFTERSEARSVEQGARLYEANCATCHGQDGLGLNGVGPALNTPHLFGYDYFADIDNQIAVVNARLNDAGTQEEIDDYTAQLGVLEAEREALGETILYDFTVEVDELDAEIEALDADIVASVEGLDNASRIDFTVQQRQVELGLPDLESEKVGILAQYEEEEPAEEAAAEESEDMSEEDGDAEAMDEEASEDVAEEEDAAEEGEEELSPEEAIAQEYLAEYPEMANADAERLAEIDLELEAIAAELAPLEALADARQALIQERNLYQAVNDAHLEVVALREEIALAEGQLVDDEDNEELVAEVAEKQTMLDEAETTRESARMDLVTNLLIVDMAAQGYDPASEDLADFNRTSQVAWAGSTSDFIHGTLTGGRPTSSSYWPQPMAAWSQVSGGPLRVDQIVNLVDYIMNWDRDFTIQDLRNVNQFARVPSQGGEVAGGGEDVIGTDDLGEITGELVNFTGDAENGQSLFASYGCVGCHGAQDGTGPALTGLYARVEGNEGGRLDGVDGDPTAYLVQSISAPNAFVVDGYNAGLMPQNFTTDQMSYQDLADIVAYMEQQN